MVEHIYGGMCPEDVQKAIEVEFEMAFQDRIMEETQDKKNAVEAYVYDMRNKVLLWPIIRLFRCKCEYFQLSSSSCVFQLHGIYKEFVTDPERKGLTAKLQEVENWLYEDGENKTKGVYVAKLEELKKVSLLLSLIYFRHFS